MGSLEATQAGSQGAREQPRSPPSPQRTLLFLRGQQFHQSWTQGIQPLTQAAVREQVTWDPAVHSCFLLVSQGREHLSSNAHVHTRSGMHAQAHMHTRAWCTHTCTYTLTHTLMCTYTPPKYQVQAETAVPTGSQVSWQQKKGYPVPLL